MQIGLKTRRFINIEEDHDGTAGAAMLVRNFASAPCMPVLFVSLDAARHRVAAIRHGAPISAQGDPAFAGSHAATQTMLNKFKAVAKKGADIDAQVRLAAQTCTTSKPFSSVLGSIASLAHRQSSHPSSAPPKARLVGDLQMLPGVAPVRQA